MSNCCFIGINTVLFRICFEYILLEKEKNIINLSVGDKDCVWIICISKAHASMYILKFGNVFNFVSIYAVDKASNQLANIFLICK